MIGLVATTLVATWANPLSAHDPCNRYLYQGRPNPAYPNGVQYVCKHDLENNDDQFNEYYTYKAWEMDGHLFQHQDQFRKHDLFLGFYYGLKDPNGYWQWQQTERFDTGDYSHGGTTRTHEFALRHPNGAWQHEYAWRDFVDGHYFYCYAQSEFDEVGEERYPSFFCNTPDGQVSGDYSPVPLRDPSFRDHTDW